MVGDGTLPASQRALSTAAARIRPAVFSELQSRIDGLLARGEELIGLHIGDTCLPPPDGARRVLGSFNPDDPGLYRYGATAGLDAVREAFVTAAFTRRGRTADPRTEVLVGNGGTHALFCAAAAVLDPGDEVLVASPYWPLAPGVFQACGASPIEVPLTQHLYADPDVDAGELLRARVGPRTKAIYFITPNNPDGKVLGLDDLEHIAEVARAHDLWVIADEVYADIVFPEGRSAIPSIADLGGMRERTITLHSLSKSHALAGIRIGFVHGPADVIAAARRIATHSSFNVSVAMQRAAVAALADPEFSERARDTYRAARDEAIDALAGAPITFHRAEGATYLFLDFTPALSRREGALAEARPLSPILERAVDRGVLLAPGLAFGADYGTFARLCFTSVEPPLVRRGIERLRAAVDAWLEDRP